MREFISHNFEFLLGYAVFLTAIYYITTYFIKNKINDEILNKNEIENCKRIEILENELKFIHDVLKLIAIESRIYLLAAIGGIIVITKQRLPSNIIDFDKAMI